MPGVGGGIEYQNCNVCTYGIYNVNSNGQFLFDRNGVKYDSVLVDVQPDLQAKTVNPSTSQQYVLPDSGKDGLSSVTVNAVTSAIDANIAAGNIKDGVSILGVTGNYSGSAINNQNKTVSPTTSQQSISADAGYTGLGTVTVNAVTYEIDSNIVPGNILAGVEILGVTGTDAGYDAGYSAGYEQGQSECPEPDLTTLNVTPTTSAQTLTPSEGDGWNEVDVAAVTSAIDANITAGNIKNGVTILGVQGTYSGSGGGGCLDTIDYTCNDIGLYFDPSDVAYTATVKNNNK